MYFIFSSLLDSPVQCQLKTLRRVFFLTKPKIKIQQLNASAACGLNFCSEWVFSQLLYWLRARGTAVYIQPTSYCVTTHAGTGRPRDLTCSCSLPLVLTCLSAAANQLPEIACRHPITAPELSHIYIFRRSCSWQSEPWTMCNSSVQQLIHQVTLCVVENYHWWSFIDTSK